MYLNWYWHGGDILELVLKVLLFSRFKLNFSFGVGEGELIAGSNGNKTNSVTIKIEIDMKLTWGLAWFYFIES